MFLLCARKGNARQQFASIPTLIKEKSRYGIGLLQDYAGRWSYFTTEGASASALGVATFQTALISALLLSGLLCDRLASAWRKKYFTPWRITGAATFAVMATIFDACRHGGSTSFITARYHSPFWRGYSLAVAACGKCEVAEAAGSMLVSITWNFIVGFCVTGRGAGVRIAIGRNHRQLPDTWWILSRWSLGLLSIGLMAIPGEEA